MLLRYSLAWVFLAILAIINGTLRELFFRNTLSMPELAAHQISSFTAIIILGIGIWGIFRLWQPESERQAMLVGVFWLVLTVAFEFLFGHFVAGHPWRRLLADYNIATGRLWPLVLIWIAVAPWLLFRLRHRLAA